MVLQHIIHLSFKIFFWEDVLWACYYSVDEESDLVVYPE